jgi:Flp pilus assembly protein TadG
MALMLPLLLMVLFGIIDMGYYIYGYSTIYMAARNGTEKAASLAPYTTQLNNWNEGCMAAILDETRKGVVLFPDFNSSNIQVSYPTNKRELGEPIQVQVTYSIKPLTPLFQFVMVGNNGVMSVNITARRSVENLGAGPPSPDHPNGIVCSQ